MAAALPERNEQYGTKEYWNSRYEAEADGTTFDWFKTYSEIASVFNDLIPDKNARILMLGCGNSRLSEDMYDDGYRNIVNVDYSSVVIDQMKSRHESTRPEMEWHVQDVRDLTFQPHTFDVAIDKGTMDAMMTAKGDVWDPPDQVIQDCTSEVSEVLKVLKPNGGLFIYLTFGQPHFRRRYLIRPKTTLKVQEMGDAFHYYLYVVRTEEDAS